MRTLKVTITGTVTIDAGRQADAVFDCLIEAGPEDSVSQNDRINVWEGIIKEVALPSLIEASLERGAVCAFEPFGQAVEAG